MWTLSLHCWRSERGGESKQPGLCMAVFVFNIFVYVHVRKKKKVRDKLRKRCVGFRTAECMHMCVCGVMFSKHNPGGTSEAAR